MSEGKAKGRPSKYDPKYIDEMIAFFKRDYTMKKHGKTEACDFPSIARFAVNIGVNKTTIYEWAKHHKEFSNALKKCQEMQEDIIVNNSLKGSYNGSFAQFLLKNNFGYKDRVEQETTIKEKRTINIVNDSDES